MFKGFNYTFAAIYALFLQLASADPQGKVKPSQSGINLTVQDDAYIYNGIRLTGGSEFSNGVVEVSYNDLWGTICDDAMDFQTATTLCQFLGFTGATNWYPFGGLPAEYSIQQSSTNIIWLDDFYCTGSESNPNLCQHQPVGVHNCRAIENVVLFCSTDIINSGVRLTAGLSPSYGIVEVRYGNTWGTICDDRMDETTAAKLCSFLGFYRYSQWYSFSNVPSGIILDKSYSNIILYDEYFCDYSSNQIGDCQHADPYVTDCSEKENVVLACSQNDIMFYTNQIRLVNSNYPNFGIVEASYNYEWGTICYVRDETTAAMLCKFLGFDALEFVSSYSSLSNDGIYTVTPSDYARVWLAYLQCYGHESSIDECYHTPAEYTLCGPQESTVLRCRNRDIVGSAVMRSATFPLVLTLLVQQLGL